MSRRLSERVHEGCDRAVALTRELDQLAAVEQPAGEPVADLTRVVHVAGELVRRADVEVRRLEEVVDLVGRELAALGVRDRLDLLRELDLQPARKVEPVPVLEQVRDTALARLRVHADDRLVRPADVARVDGEVGDVPDGAVGLLLLRVHALLDRVLM